MSVTDNVLATCIIQIGYDGMGQCVCCVYVWVVVSRTKRNLFKKDDTYYKPYKGTVTLIQFL